MLIYDSVKQKNKKLDIEYNGISIYNCGPTVYNYVHIGNVRPLITFDVLYRFLLSKNINVNYVHNLTDIDDKIILAAKKENISEYDLTSKYINAYKDLFTILNIKEMNMPKVSDNIDEIINFIEKLISNGAAYISDNDVYFDISKAKDYGIISKQNIQSLVDGVRKENVNNKKSNLDFVLWKNTTDGLNWNSPWGKGRPGWHTECVVLINKFIGKSVNIHGGGIDLKFPHHENENAQNLALNNIPLANIWMHVGHVNINNQKMAKSANNFILVKDFVNKENANGLRWFFYQSKYQNPLNYTPELFKESCKNFDYIVKKMNSIKSYLVQNNESFKYDQKIGLLGGFKSALEQDLNFPEAITTIYDSFNELDFRQKISIKFFKEKADKILSQIHNCFLILGIKVPVDLEDDVVLLLKQKSKFLEEKNYIESDKIRIKLLEKGIY